MAIWNDRLRLSALVLKQCVALALLSVRLTSLTLSCTAEAHVPKPRGAAVAMCAPRLAAREK
jgi:hypothetical protein